MKPNSKINIPAIPILSVPDKPIVSTTQDHLPVADILEDLVVYKDGGAAIVLESTSLNFSLLSDKEQQAVIAAYAALINSLSFSVQIVIRTQRKDISKYLKYLDSFYKQTTNTAVNTIIKNYRQFIVDTVKKKNVLGKSFYMVLPFSPLELGVAKSAMTLTKRSGPLPYSKTYVVKKAKIALYPKRDHMVRQAGRLGLKLRQLTTPQLIDLYYDIYNAEPPNARKSDQELLK